MELVLNIVKPPAPIPTVANQDAKVDCVMNMLEPPACTLTGSPPTLFLHPFPHQQKLSDPLPVIHLNRLGGAGVSISAVRRNL